MGMKVYYLSRLLLSVILGGLSFIAGAPWWIAAIVCVTVIAFFLWAPRSGRYVVRPELGFTALRRDERSQAVTNRAARMGFVATILAAGGLVVYFAIFAEAKVPVWAVALVVALGGATYFLSDSWLRRT